MKISSPTVGPIVGYTTPTQCRMLLRGLPERDGARFHRAFGAVRWRPAGSTAWQGPRFNKLSPNFDLTGVLVLGPLAPDTVYEYQAGWFLADAELDVVQRLPARHFVWPDAVGRFRSASADPAAPRSYVVGSCRYLLRLFGGSYFDDRGDKAFRSIAEQIDRQGLPLDGLLMIGDQIYADDLAGTAPDRDVDQFLARYRAVFTQPHIAGLMARVPTYMILDDHEIEDNWPAKATPQERLTLYPNAIHAYQVYQCSHGPLFKATPDGRIDGLLDHFWYTFEDGCAQWFVMDVRTERALGAGRRIVRDTQLRRLKAWLDDGSGKVKLVVSSVPVFPDLGSEAGDKWGAFPEQRRELLDFIRERSIRKVVFVSGDLHCSFACELGTPSDPSFRVHAVVSSSFFWPCPHTDPSDLRFGKPLAGTGGVSYLTRRLSRVFATDNFVRLDVAPSKIQVSFFERKGRRLGSVLTLPL